MANFTDFILTLDRMGITEVLLPFVLIFTVVFAVMKSTKILGDNKKFHAAIAFVLAMGVVIPHVTNSYPDPKYDAVNIINQALPNVSIIAIAIVAVLLLMGTFGLKFPTKSSKSIVGTVLWILSFGLIIFIFGSAAGWGFEIPNWLGFLNNPDTQALLIIFLVFGLVINYIVGDDKKPEPGERMDRWKKNLNHIYDDGDSNEE